MANLKKTKFSLIVDIMKFTSLWPLKNEHITKFIQWYLISYIIFCQCGVKVTLNLF